MPMALCTVFGAARVFSAVVESCSLHRTFLVGQGCAASFGLCVTKHCRIFVLPLCHLMTRYMLRLCLLRRKCLVGNLLAC